MNPLSGIKRDFNRLSLANRLLCLILGCGLFFAIAETALQLYLGYRADIAQIETQISRVETNFLKSISKSTWNMDADQVVLQLEGALNARDIVFLEVITETALNSQKDTFFLFEPDTGRAVRWNRAFTDISGYSDGEVAELPVPVSYYSPEDLVRASEFITGVFERGSGTIELELITKPGRKIPFEYNVSVFESEQGGPRYMISIGRDISRQKQAEQERLRAERRAAEQEKQALVGQIAGKMAHDFNNILGVIMGNAELARMDAEGERLKKIIEIIHGQTVRGRNMTRNLIAFAKDQEPKQEFFKIKEKIDLVLDLMKKDLTGIEVVRRDQGEMPGLLADPGMIEHALVNLIQNAIHAVSKTKDPRIAIRTSSSDREICLEMEDNGCGIPKVHLKDIFSPSFTLKGSRDRSGAYQKGIKGTGYGMSNVKKYIEQHHGEIRVESEPGMGTCFRITLPVTLRELTPEEKIRITETKTFTGKKILLVEDEPAISDIQHNVLTGSPFSHEVDIAENGETALELFQPGRYDLVSLDYVLPGGMTGMEVYSNIRELDPGIPILFISGNIEFLESIRELKRKDTLVDHLSKPCGNKNYVDCINRLLERVLQ